MYQSIEKSTQKHVVIVGGGIAGLSAATYLARAGVAVTVIEKSANLGGRAATQYHEGFSFNRGAHAFYTGGSATTILKELDITYSHGGPGSNSLFVLDREQGNKPFILFPATPFVLLCTHLFDMADKLEFVRLISTLKVREDLASMSVQEWLEKEVRRARVRQVLEAFARTQMYTAALDLVSADALIYKFLISFKNPIHYIDQGWQSLANALRSKAEHYGAKIISGVRVNTLEQREGSVQGVWLDNGNFLAASAVIVATAPKDAVKLVDERVYPALRKTVDALVPSSMACLDVALERLPSTRHTVVQDLNALCFMTAQSHYARVAPHGRAIISLFKPLHPANPGDPDSNRKDLENLLDIAQPGWRDVLVKSLYLPHIETVSALSLASNGGLAGRPGPCVSDLANLYLVGDWIGSEGFAIDASTASARRVAHMILYQDSHQEEAQSLAVSAH